MDNDTDENEEDEPNVVLRKVENVKVENDNNHV